MHNIHEQNTKMITCSKMKLKRLNSKTVEADLE